MKQQTETAVETKGRALSLTRILNAPRELVFKAWTDPKHLIRWWGPSGFTNTFHEIAVKPGGVWRFMMHGPDGVDYPNQIVFSEVVKPERLVYRHGSGEPNDEDAFDVTVTFEKHGVQTKLTMHMVVKSEEALQQMIAQFGIVEGGKQTLDRLEEELATMQ